jgi:hypothetical protein
MAAIAKQKRKTETVCAESELKKKMERILG